MDSKMQCDISWHPLNAMTASGHERGTALADVDWDGDKSCADCSKSRGNVVLRCLGGAAVGRRTSDLAVMGSIPGPGVIRHLGQLSLSSLRGK